MPNPWFRLYHEFADDAKVQMLSEAMQRRLVMMFCSRCKEEALQETQRAFAWRITEKELAETKAIFIQNGFIDENWNLLNWNHRQFISDSSTDRVRRYREGKKQYETLPKQDETVNVTEPEQNRTEQSQKQNIKTTPTTREKKEQRWLEYQEAKTSLRWAFETFAKFAAWPLWDEPDKWPIDIQALQSIKQVTAASLGMYRREN